MMAGGWWRDAGGRLLALALCTLCVASRAQDAPDQLDLSRYRLSFDENFTRLDITDHGPGGTWIAHTPWHGDFGDASFDGPGPQGPFALGPDGLVITARRDAAGHWHSGLISSVDRDGPGQHGFAQRYGYFEMRARLPGGMGTWPAFWLIGTDKSVAASEIDVIEYYGGFPKYFHITEHVWQGKGHKLLRASLQSVPDGMLSRQFNDFGVLITPAETAFYLNRRKIWDTPTPPEYRQKFYILADLALGGGWSTAALTSPRTMDIRYIHVYQNQALEQAR